MYTIIESTAIKNYMDLFLRKRQGHLTEYAYTGSVDYFDLFIQNNESYYLYSLENKIIEYSINSLSSLIGERVSFFEIGPGSQHSIEAKVIPFIKGMNAPLSYTAMDLHVHYAQEACAHINKHLPNLKTYAKQLDCSKPYTIEMDEKKCILFLGSTISNFTNENISNTFTNFYDALSSGDFLVFSVDYNTDIVSIEKAYNNSWMHKLTLCIMSNFQNIFSPAGFDATKFVSEYEWNTTTNAVHMNVVATEDQKFHFNGHDISISKNSKYHVLTSRKFKPEFIENIVTKTGFKVVERFFDKDKKVCLYLVQK